MILHQTGVTEVEKPKVLIGFLSNDKAESVSSLTRVFIDGLNDEFAFIPLRANRRHGNTHQAKLNFLNIYYFAKHLFLWVYLLVRYRPHIAHYPVTSYWSMEKSLLFLKVARWFGARTIGHLHGGAFIDFWKTLSYGRKRYASAEFRRLSAFIALSPGWKEKLIQESIIATEKLFVVTNPLDPEFEKACLSMPVKREGRILLGLGVMDRQKGVFDLIEAAHLAKDQLRHRIMLVGPEREPGIHARLRKRINELGLAEHFEISAGVWGKEKIALFHKTCILLLPSYWENLPVVVLEAAAAGIPSIVSPVGAVPEFFTNEQSALVVNPGDIQGLASAIIDLEKHENKREKLGVAARTTFCSMLSREHSLSALQKTYNSVLHRQKITQ